MKKNLLLAVISLMSFTSVVSCSDEAEQINTQEYQSLNLNLDDFEFSLRKDGLTIPKDNPEALEDGINSRVKV